MNFTVKNLGPIKDVSVDVADLTILIGTQASGKSLFLQMFKLAKDRNSVVNRLDNFGFIVKENPDNLLNKYLGEGLSELWTSSTEVIDTDSRFALKEDWVSNLSDSKLDKVFYIPAQRILSISDGRPKNFMEFSTSDPYVLRLFSETLRLYIQGGLNGDNVIYPSTKIQKGSVQETFSKTIFHDGKVVLEEKSGQRKIAMDIDGVHLPLMTWSAGQKEFLPLMMAFNSMLGSVPNTINAKQYEYVIIEEPEMGLHPLAIQSIILQILEFMQKGYKVIVSTHSPVLLEFVWVLNALKHIQEEQRHNALIELFRMSASDSASVVLKDICRKQVNTYFFSRHDSQVTATDISSLDAMSDNIDITEWGGLAQFSTLANDVVAKYIANYGE